MTTYTSHGTHCHECNRLADITQREAAETGELQSRAIHSYPEFHVAASRDNGINKRIIGEENPERLYQL